jgi:predicted RNA-binding Zn-ribbon protein involved in translation (DUF1610 family)
VPELLDDLDIAIAGEVRFVEHGFRSGMLEADGAGASRHPAVAAHQRLCLALFGDDTNAHPGCAGWFDARHPAQLARHLLLYLQRLVTEPRLPVLAHDISSAAKRAHHVIDMPKDLVFYGPCPECGRDIVQERIHRDDQETEVQCRFPSCGYGEPLDVHHRRILDASEDRWMTLTELVSAITSAGEIVTRKQIEAWIYRNSSPLVRERRARPRYEGGALVYDEVWTYRLGDVLARARAAAEKRERNQRPELRAG